MKISQDIRSAIAETSVRWLFIRLFVYAIAMFLMIFGFEYSKGEHSLFSLELWKNSIFSVQPLWAGITFVFIILTVVRRLARSELLR